jgi:hypothetical protein
VVNLLGPRAPSQRPPNKFWNEFFTHVQLRYTFVSAADDSPMPIGRTFLTFYDFDVGASQVAGASPAIEMMQMGPQAAHVELPSVTEIHTSTQWSDVPSLSAGARGIIATTMPGANTWGTAVHHGTVFGVGDDNPFDPYDLTAQQARRSVMAMFERVSSFQVRYAIGACCNTVRSPTQIEPKIPHRMPSR